MTAFILRFAKERVSPDREADFRRDHRRTNGDRYPAGHSFHQHRTLPEVSKSGPSGYVLRGRAAAMPVRPRASSAFANARDVLVFIFAIAVALGGLTAVIITPPI